MHVILDKALTATAERWPSLILFFAWVGQATAILNNPRPATGGARSGADQALLASFSAALLTPAGETLREWGYHFLKITQRYWTGLFQCYDVAGLPRTDNDLEHLFGKLRHQERHTTGRKVATPSLIIRGSVRVLSAVVSWLRPLTPMPIRPGSPGAVAGRTPATRQTPAGASAPAAFPSASRAVPGCTGGATRQAEFASIEKNSYLQVGSVS